MTRWIVSGSMPKKPAKVPSPPSMLKVRPNSVGRGMPVMPFGPLVSDTQLIMTMRMISPKASVTIAR